MHKMIPFALLAAGVLLIILGADAYHSLSSDLSRFFTGSATDKSIWLLVCGIAATIAGLAGLARRIKIV